MTKRVVYPKDYFESIRPEVIEMISNRMRIDEIAKHFGIKHMTFAGMLCRAEISAVRVRYENSKRKAA